MNPPLMLTEQPVGLGDDMTRNGETRLEHRVAPGVFDQSRRGFLRGRKRKLWWCHLFEFRRCFKR